MTTLLPQIWVCVKGFGLYIICCALLAVLINFVFPKIPRFIFRKILHLIAFTSVLVIIHVAPGWVAAAVTCVWFIVIVWPILVLLERCDWYANLFVQKSKGEVKKSMILIFGMACFMISVCWGLLGRKDLLIASIAMWGMGDAMAAVVGQSVGRHHFSWERVRRKTYEGTIAMFLASFVVGVVCFWAFSDVEFGFAVFMCLVAAVFGSFVELVSSSELDTITVPCAIAFVLWGMSLL